jgi:hypothetical protein
VGRSSRLLLGLALWTAAASIPAAADGLYLHVIPTARADGARVERGAPLRVAVYVPQPAFLAASLATGARAVADDHVELELTPYPQLASGAEQSFRAPSFVIDFEEPAVRALHAALVARHGDSPSLEELMRFTDEAIPRKSMERGWDLASQVAASGVGDCTEHAVLMAALARAVGRPARVAVGIVVARVEGELRAFGHAWMETREGGRWLPLDATPMGPAMEAWAYLPITVMQDEGPGYAMGLARAMQRSWVRRLEIRGSAASPAAPERRRP